MADNARTSGISEAFSELLRAHTLTGSSFSPAHSVCRRLDLPAFVPREQQGTQTNSGMLVSSYEPMSMSVATMPGVHPVAMSRPQVGIERLPTRRMSNEPRESMNCKSCRKRKVCNRSNPKPSLPFGRLGPQFRQFIRLDRPTVINHHSID